MLQKDVAKHLFMSERNLRDVLKALRLDHARDGLEKIREAYIRDLRNKASGNSAALMAVRIRKETAEADKIERFNAVEEKELIPSGDIQPGLELYVHALWTEFLSLSDKLKPQIDQLYGIDLDSDVIDSEIRDALERFAESVAGHAESFVEDGAVVTAADENNDQ